MILLAIGVAALILVVKHNSDPEKVIYTPKKLTEPNSLSGEKVIVDQEKHDAEEIEEDPHNFRYEWIFDGHLPETLEQKNVFMHDAVVRYSDKERLERLYLAIDHLKGLLDPKGCRSDGLCMDMSCPDLHKSCNPNPFHLEGMAELSKDLIEFITKEIDEIKGYMAMEEVECMMDEREHRQWLKSYEPNSHEPWDGEDVYTEAYDRWSESN